MNRRAALQNNPRELSSFIRKNPFTLAEAFRVDGDKSLFNPENLNYQRDYLSWNTDIVERGNFEWKGGERFSEVEWRPNKQGRWEIPRGFSLENPNRVRKNNDRYYPENTILFRAAMDPFKYDKVKDGRRSDCASFVGKMYDASNPSDPWGDVAICRYRHRAATTSLANEDMLKQCWYFGCQILPESNVDHWKAHFKAAGCDAFLMTLPGEDEPGIYSDGHGGMLQSICDYIEDYVENQYKKIFFIGLIDDMLEFDVGDTTKSDETIAFGILRIAMKRKTYRKPSTVDNDVKNYFRTYKLTKAI